MKCSKFISLMVFLGMWLGGCQGMSSARAFIEYRRTGGFAGVDDHLVIDAVGRAAVHRNSEPCEFDLDTNMMNQLRTLLEDVSLSELPSESKGARRGADFSEYTITYRSHTVRTVDGFVPESLWPILETLNQVIEACGES